MDWLMVSRFVVLELVCSLADSCLRIPFNSLHLSNMFPDLTFCADRVIVSLETTCTNITYVYLG